MKKYFAPIAEVYNYSIEEDLLGASTGEYVGDEIIENEGNDPLGQTLKLNRQNRLWNISKGGFCYL